MSDRTCRMLVEVMQNLSRMCRICLATDVRLCSITRSLQDMYEKLTELTFERGDGRPLVACYICYARLRNCYQLRTSCLQSEKLLTDMLTSGELVPHSVSGTNTLRAVSLPHFSVGHILQDSTECHVKEEAPEVIHDAGLEQQNTEDIKIEPQEEHDAQIDDDVQSSHIEDPLNAMKREPDDVEVDYEDIKLDIENTVLEENEPNEAGLPSQPPINIFPKIVEVVLERVVPNDTVPATGVPALKKLEETDSLLLTESKNTNKSIVVDKLMCDVCSKCCTQKCSLTRHMIYNHTDKKPFQCKVCHKRFTRKSNLTQHIFTHTDKKPFQCNVCNKRFARKFNLTQHMLTHTDKKRFQCDVCNKRFTHKCALTQHIFTHTDKKPFQCSVCNKRFTRKFNFTQHMFTHKLFQCDVCNKRFTHKCILTQHMLTHTDKKPFQCDVCNKRFTHKCSLTRHNMNTHTDKKGFQCDVCYKHFTRKCSLTQHMYTHTDQKQFQCDVCNKCFSLKSSLTQHLFTHTDKKPFHCDVCNKQFTLKYNLTQHMFTHTDMQRF